MKKFEEVKDKLSMSALRDAVKSGILTTPSDFCLLPISYKQRLECVQMIVAPCALVDIVHVFGYSPAESIALVRDEYAAIGDLPCGVALERLSPLREARQREIVALSLEQLMKIKAIKDLKNIASPEGEKHVLRPAGIYRDHLDCYRELPEDAQHRLEFTLQKAQELLGRSGLK